MLFETKYFRRNKKGQTIAIACEAECLRHKKRLAIGFGLSFFAGALSGLFGVGGGVLLVPILILVVRLPVRLAIGTSMFLVALTSLSGVFQHSLLGNVDFTLGLLLSVGAFFGTLVGAWLSRRISTDKVELIFALALIAVAIQMILKYI